MNISKRGQSKSKGQTDSLWKDQIYLAIPKKPFGTADFRDHSKDTNKSKDFGKLLKKVTSTLMNTKVDPSKLFSKDRERIKTGQKKRRKHNSLLGCSMSGSSTSRTSDHILEISGFSVEPRKPAGRSKRQLGEYGHAPRVIK